MFTWNHDFLIPECKMNTQSSAQLFYKYDRHNDRRDNLWLTLIQLYEYPTFKAIAFNLIQNTPITITPLQ